MSDGMTNLRALRDKVAAGGVEFPTMMPDFPANDWFAKAFHGSLDAAMALHKAMLPGWEWRLRDNRAWVWRGVQIYGGDEIEDNVGSGLPARAWLLAIIDALIEEVGE